MIRLADKKNRDVRVTAYVAQHAHAGTGVPTGANAATGSVDPLKKSETPYDSKFWKGVGSANRPSLTPPASGRQGLRLALHVATKHIAEYNRRLRLDPDELSAKFRAMASTAFTFLRANPALAELQYQSVEMAPLTNWFGRPAPLIWSTKDTHVGNFAFFRGPKTAEGPDGRPHHLPIFGVNDFDMAGPGSAEADVARLLTSALVMMTERGIPDRMQILEQMAERYFSRIVDIDGDHQKCAPYLTRDELKSKALVKLYEKAANTTQEDVFSKFFNEDGSPRAEKGVERIKGPDEGTEHPLRRAEIAKGIEDLSVRLDDKGFETPGLVRPLVIVEMYQKKDSGGSSIGMERLYIRLEGIDEDVLLEAKMLMPSPANTLEGDLSKVDAEEVLKAQHEMESRHYPLVSTFTMDGRQFYTREREPEKKNIDLASLKADDLKAFMPHAADGLARLHAAPDPESGSESQAVKLKEWVGSDVNRGVQGSLAYAVEAARQNFADHAEFCVQQGLDPVPFE